MTGAQQQAIKAFVQWRTDSEKVCMSYCPKVQLTQKINGVAAISRDLSTGPPHSEAVGV